MGGQLFKGPSQRFVVLRLSSSQCLVSKWCALYVAHHNLLDDHFSSCPFTIVITLPSGQEHPLFQDGYPCPWLPCFLFSGWKHCFSEVHRAPTEVSHPNRTSRLVLAPIAALSQWWSQMVMKSQGSAGSTPLVVDMPLLPRTRRTTLAMIRKKLFLLLVILGLFMLVVFRVPIIPPPPPFLSTGPHHFQCESPQGQPPNILASSSTAHSAGQYR